MKRVKGTEWNPRRERLNCLRLSQSTDNDLKSQVQGILQGVLTGGDAALVTYTKQFDGVTLRQLRVDKQSIDNALTQQSEEWISAMKGAIEAIKTYHLAQIEKGFIQDKGDGVIRGMRVLPIERVGLYIPGGRAAYPSTVLMNVIPAQIAGVKEIVLFTPPDIFGNVHPAIGAAASLLGINEIYSVGGAQSVAAAAYGTESIKPVDKIVGPGNAYVAEAKKQVFGTIGIDMIAGPSEILIIADESANPTFVASDLMAQAEHDPDACAIFITPSKAFADQVEAAIAVQLEKAPRQEIIRQSLENNGLCVLVSTIEEAIALSNAYAPEHLELCFENAQEALDQITAAGSVFIGSFTPESTGDYITGTNHTLPTSGTARFQSPLGVYDFVKRMAVASYTKEALREVAPAIRVIAQSEGLESHWQSVAQRLIEKTSKREGDNETRINE